MKVLLTLLDGMRPDALTACGSELKKAPSGGNREARIKIKAPIRIVKRLITPVIVTSPIF